MACSGAKLDLPSPALELYRGVMYSTYRTHLRHSAQPRLVILSALHGFLEPQAVIAPYDRRMTAPRAEEMIASIAQYMGGVTWPTGIRKIFFAGGAQYRRVMRAAVDHLMRCGQVLPDVVIEATHGGIGYQRAHLGRYLDTVPSWQAQRMPSDEN